MHCIRPNDFLLWGVEMTTFFIIIAIVVLLVVAVLIFFLGKNRKDNRLTPLAGVAFAFVISGILFSENQYVSYSLMGVGVILAVIDIFIRSKNK